MEEFDSIKFYLRSWSVQTSAYAFWSPTWTDVTSDVLTTPAPRCESIGIRGNGIMDRFADAGEMTIALKNETGYYTTTAQGLPNRLGALRMTTTWDGVEVIQFEGFFKPGSLKVNADVTNNKYIQVTFIDFPGWATGSFQLDNIQYQTNMDVRLAVIYLLNQLEKSIRVSQPYFVSSGTDFIQVSMSPRHYQFETGIYTFPDVFDLQNKQTTIGGEARRLIESELGYCYQKYKVKDNDANSHWGNVLVIENKKHRRFGTVNPAWGNGSYDNYPVYSGDHDGDMPLMADGTSHPLMADGTSHPLMADSTSITITESDLEVNGQNDFTFYAHHHNLYRVKTRPRKVDDDATTVLWTLQTSTLVEAGATVTGLRGRFRDPTGGASYVNCIAITTPVENTDYKAYANADGTGTDLTSQLHVEATLYPAEVEIKLTNLGGTDLYTGGDILFQVRGQGVYQYDTTEVLIDLRDINDRFVSDLLYPVGGISEIVFDLYYKTDPNDIVDVIDYVQYWNSYPKLNAQTIELLANRDTKNMRLWQYSGVGSNFRLDVGTSTMDYDEAVYINGISFEVIEGKYIKWVATLFEEPRAIMTRA